MSALAAKRRNIRPCCDPDHRREGAPCAFSAQRLTQPKGTVMSVTNTYPVGGVDAPSVTTGPIPGPLDFWSTLGWLAVAALTYVAAMMLYVAGFVIWAVATHTYIEDIRTFAQLPLLTYLMHAVSMTSAALVLVIPARRGGPSVRSYLALTWPQWRYIAIGLAVVGVSWSIFLGLSLLHIFPDSREAIHEYRQILGNPWALTLYWLVLVGTVPVAQEIVFRGFVQRGWSASSLGGFGAAVLIAFAWAVVQPGHNVPMMFTVFCLGLICGVMRWRSGSTVLAIMMHMAWNGATGLYYALTMSA